MSEAKHTPGPWKVDHVNHPLHPDYISISSSGHTGLAEVVWRMEDEDESPAQQANARLIAAAPELLEVLEAIQADRSWRTNDNSLVPRINDAIAKAKGYKP